MKDSRISAVLVACLAAATAHGQETSPAIEMVSVPGGCFQMGTTGYEKHEQPVHKACVGNFEIGKDEVTIGQWRAVMGAGSNPSNFTGCGDTCPVDKVSWNQAQDFIAKLNARGKGHFRLPTEAEWEYACRSGGKDEIWPGGVTADKVGDIAWFDKGAAGNVTHPVGTKAPNGLGIHDMAGNVWEWVQDVFVSPYPTAIVDNPRIESGGDGKRVMRGGSWNGKVNYVRCGIRTRYAPDYVDRSGRVGFRLVRDAGS